MIVDHRIYLTVVALAYAVMVIGVFRRDRTYWGAAIAIGCTMLIAFLDWLWS